MPESLSAYLSLIGALAVIYRTFERQPVRAIILECD